jgi:hypothetical protein
VIKIPEMINLKRAQVYSGSQPQRSQAMDGWPMVTHIMVGAYSRGKRKLLISWYSGSKETDRGRG